MGSAIRGQRVYPQGSDAAYPALRMKNEAKTAKRCRRCNPIHYGQDPSEACPYCFPPPTAFQHF